MGGKEGESESRLVMVNEEDCPSKARQSKQYRGKAIQLHGDKDEMHVRLGRERSP